MPVENPSSNAGSAAYTPPPAPPSKAPTQPTRTTSTASKQSGYTAQTWAKALLYKLGVQPNNANVQAIVAWEAAEGGHWGNNAWFNPLNTTQPASGATSMNSVGVKAYTSWQQGLAATVQTLKNGNYGKILATLKGSNPGAIAQAVVSSPWGTHAIDVGGNYGSYGTQSRNTSQRTVTSSALDSPTTVSDYLGDPAISAQYGYLSAYLHQPGVGPLIATAAKEGWNAQEMQSALLGYKVNGHAFPQAASWFKHTSATARQAQATRRLDPATYNQQLGQQYAEVLKAATSLGVALPSARLRQIAATSLQSGWTATQLDQALAAEFHYQTGTRYTGEAAKTVGTLKQMAADYLVPLSNSTLQGWTRQVLGDQTDPAGFKEYLSQQAKSLYPTLSKAIDAGTTVRQYLDPYAQLAGQTLEMNPESIDWTNPKWMKALNTTTPDGQRAPMSLSDWQTYLRGLPDYQTTAGARQQAYSLASTITKTFGKVAQ